MSAAIEVTELRQFGWEQTLSLTAGGFVCVRAGDAVCDTLFPLLCGLRAPDEGTVKLLDTAVYELPEDARAAFRREKVGAIPRTLGFLPEVRLIDQLVLAMPCDAREEAVRVLRFRCFDFLELHSLYSLAGKASSRTRALAAIVRATARGYRALVLDGCFDALPAREQSLMWRTLPGLLPPDAGVVYLTSARPPEEIEWGSVIEL